MYFAFASNGPAFLIGPYLMSMESILRVLLKNVVGICFMFKLQEFKKDLAFLTAKSNSFDDRVV